MDADGLGNIEGESLVKSEGRYFGWTDDVCPGENGHSSFSIISRKISAKNDILEVYSRR
jgi:hypothetical protein